MTSSCLKMKLFLLITFIYVIVNSDAQNTTTSSVSSSQAPATTPAPKSTEAPKKIDTKSSALCQKCHCDSVTKVLDCSNSNFSTLFNKDEVDVLQHGDVQFETIRLDHNSIQKIDPFPALSIKKLDLRHNLIDTIAPLAFQNLTELESLDLSNNKLESKALTPKTFEGHYSSTTYLPLGKLKELNLGYNKIHSLDSDLFDHFANLESLSLASNPFQVIDQRTEGALSDLHNLKTLDLSFIQISALPPYVLHAPRNLENLHLTGNLFTQIPETLNFAVSLKLLNMDENLIESIHGENVFPDLPKLEVLSMSYMSDLSNIGKGAFSGLQGLKELLMTNNPKLSYFHPDAFAKPRENKIDLDYPELEKLYLHSNNLTVLDKKLLARWDKVNTVDIRHNPWKCDCDNDWLIHVLYPQINDNTPVLSHHINCGSPKAWKNMEIDELHQKKKNLRCSDLYGSHPENDGTILIGMLLGLLVGIPLTFAVILIFRRGCFGLRNNDYKYGRAFYSRTGNDDI